MRLSISNLAWDPQYDERIGRLLNDFAVDAIEIAPSKYFQTNSDIAQERIDAVRQCWRDRGIDIVAMQSLLYGTVGLNMFGEPEVQAAMLRHLGRIASIGNGLGARRLVFGSPKNRDRSGLDLSSAMEMAVNFFRRLGDIAAASGCVICLEPNPAIYGCNFMTGTEEAAALVRMTDHPSIRLQFDIGAVTANGENAEELLQRFGGLIGHVHISEPGLQPLGSSPADHTHLGALVRRFLPADISVSIEMLTPAADDPVDTVRRAVQLAVQHYRHTGN